MGEIKVGDVVVANVTDEGSYGNIFFEKGWTGAVLLVQDSGELFVQWHDKRSADDGQWWIRDKDVYKA